MTFRRPPARGLVPSTATGRIAPHVAGSPRFHRQRPIGAYARRLSRPKPPRRPWIQFDADGFFAFAIVGLMFTAWSLGTPAAAALAAVALVYVALRFNQLGEILAPRAFILIVPAFALLSVLWSQSSVETLKYALEFALTIGVALLLSAAPYPKSVLWGLFFAFAGYTAVALGFGQSVGVGNDGQTAFSGLTASKNLLGDVTASGLLLSLACFVASIEDRRPFRALLAGGVAAVEAFVLLEARSAGALLGIVPAVLAFIFFLALRPARLSVRLGTTVFGSFAAAIMTIGYGGNLLEDVMTFFDKDPTLTGRTYLWQRAADFIAEKPALGTGFSAFWVQGNPDAEGMWRFGGVVERYGFSFHNTLIELLVNVGWIGVSVFALVALVGAVLLLRRVMTRPSLALCFWFSALVYEVVRMPIEAVGMAPFSHATVLLFAAFGSAFAARRTAAARLAARRNPAEYRMRLPRAVFQRTALRPNRSSA